jgi:hypothetical protein
VEPTQRSLEHAGLRGDPDGRLFSGDQPDRAGVAQFVCGSAVLEDARQLLQAYPCAGDDTIDLSAA